jgi:hypothetical protein
MASWTANSIMFWANAAGSLVKVTDHNRSALSEDIERIENKQRMADGTLRRYTVSKKRTWSCQWENLPSTNLVAAGLKTVDGGMSGEDIEAFHNATDGAFRLVLRRGSAKDLATPNPADSALPYQDSNFYITKVMISDYNKEVTKRGRVDLWSLSITLEEV